MNEVVKLSIRKEDIYQLVDLVSEKDTKLVYDLIKTVIDNNFAVEANNSPLIEQEKEIITNENDDLLNWEDSLFINTK